MYLITSNSNLARDLREKETELEKITGDKMKIVERSGRKLEDILTHNDPWKGADCKRPNCFLCNTKTLTGKDLKKDCTKRNILYEIRCLTCEHEQKEHIEELCKNDPELKRKMETHMKVPRYIGESGRSTYERGYEHLDQLASLSNKSHMLKHMIFKHEDQDFSQIKWGMFILAYKKNAFERQIEEAVLIDREAKKSEILNSKSEWNQCSLPRLVTRMGDQETELKELEKELLEDKKKDEEFEIKLRQLRKQRNKGRLQTEKNKPTKRQKMDDNTYVSIRNIWGQPKPSAPGKQKLNTDKETEEQQTKKHKGETLTNLTTVENKVWEGETITEFEIMETDWDKVLKEHHERLEKETEARIAQLKKQTAKIKSWELYVECKNFLEENHKSWEQRKRERETEIKRKERLRIGEEKREKIKEKVRERNLEKEIEDKMQKLPAKERNKIIIEEELRRKQDLAETKKTLWKLRSRENKM